MFHFIHEGLASEFQSFIEAMARMYDEKYGATEISKHANQISGSVNNVWNRWTERKISDFLRF